MSSHFTVIYDACVLYPAPLRDLLMRLAMTDLYRARWTDMIHDEWTRNVLKQRPDLRAEDLERTRSLMNAHVRDGLVTGFEHLIPSVELPDADDRHVVAAAIHGGASLIVTFNLKDFPPAALTAFWRSIGDEVSRVDRYEPEMNLVPTGEFRDTATPAAMARNVAKIIYGDVLPEPERAELKSWMIATETGLRRVRAGLPEGWVAGDKTGTSGLIGGTTYNYIDIGFAEGPKGEGPLTFACYFRARQTEDEMLPRGELALARVGKVIKEFAEPEKGLPLVGKLY